jgi:hypothetical protein
MHSHREALPQHAEPSEPSHLDTLCRHLTLHRASNKGVGTKDWRIMERGRGGRLEPRSIRSMGSWRFQLGAPSEPTQWIQSGPAREERGRLGTTSWRGRMQMADWRCIRD